MDEGKVFLIVSFFVLLAIVLPVKYCYEDRANMIKAGYQQEAVKVEIVNSLRWVKVK